QIGHGGGPEQIGRAQRQPADGAELLLELAGEARVEAEVPAVVRARGEFVDEELAGAGQEEFDAQHADDLQRVEQVARDLDGLAGDGGRDVGGGDGQVEDVVAVRILDDAP